MGAIKQFLILLFSLVAFPYTFYVVGKFMIFLSRPQKIPLVYGWIFNMLDNKSRLETAFNPILIDALYILGFIFQHSFMKSKLVKKLLETMGLASAERTIYSLTSSLMLHYLLQGWIPAQSIVLWQVNVEDSKVLYWTFAIIHAMAWMVIYGGSLIMDLPEILGLKQAYYELKNYAPPIAYKSFELRHLYTHVRHPSFVGLSVVLWVTNLMTLDRLLLSVMLSAYMYFAWSTDRSDIIYQKCQLKRKTQEIKSQ